jgi:hypothetical protein
VAMAPAIRVARSILLLGGNEARPAHAGRAVCSHLGDSPNPVTSLRVVEVLSTASVQM